MVAVFTIFALIPSNLEELTNIGFIFEGANVRFAYIYIDGVAQKGPICFLFFFLPLSKVRILVITELYFILG